MDRFRTVAHRLVLFGVLLFELAAPASAAPGDLDSTFASGGVKMIGFGDPAVAEDVAIQEDGKIVMAGYAVVGGDDDFAVARLKPGGTRDSTFSGDGRRTTPMGTGHGVGLAVATQPDGRIVVVGYASNATGEAFAIGRFKPNGSLDPTFSSDGKKLVDFGGGYDEANDVAIQPDGRIVVVGYDDDGVGTDDSFAIARLRPNGSLDDTFSGDGKKTTQFGMGVDIANAVAVQEDGDIVVAGYRDGGLRMAVARYTPNGHMDSTFGTGGLVSTGIGSGADLAEAVAIQDDGRIVIAGATDNGTDMDFAVIRLRRRGARDNDFDGDGAKATDLGTGNETAYGVGISDDGKIVVSGSASPDPEMGVVRYLPDGSEDPTFGVGGIVTNPFGDGRDLAIQSDGKVVVVGSTGGATDDFLVVRYEA